MIETRFEFLKHLDEVIKAPPTRNIHRKVSRLNIDGRKEIVSGPQIPPRSSSKTLEYASSKQPSLHTATQSLEQPQRFRLAMVSKEQIIISENPLKDALKNFSVKDSKTVNNAISGGHKVRLCQYGIDHRELSGLQNVHGS